MSGDLSMVGRVSGRASEARLVRRVRWGEVSLVIAKKESADMSRQALTSVSDISSGWLGLQRTHSLPSSLPPQFLPSFLPLLKLSKRQPWSVLAFVTAHSHQRCLGLGLPLPQGRRCRCPSHPHCCCCPRPQPLSPVERPCCGCVQACVCRR